MTLSLTNDCTGPAPVPQKDPPKIFDFRDYRHYLKAWSHYLKHVKKDFTHRWFAEQAGFGSQSYFRMVVKGERNLSYATIDKFTKALALGKKESRYFASMVLYNQARAEADKTRYLGDMLELCPKSEATGLTRDQLEYLTSPLLVSLREMTALPDFREDIAWICAHLRVKPTPENVRHALKTLERLGLVVRDAQGQLKHSRVSLETNAAASESEILNYHRQRLDESRDAIMTAPADQWDIAAKTIPIPKKLLPRVSEMLHGVLDDITSLINQSGDDYHEVFQINMQLFPLTATKKDESTDNTREAS